MNRPNLAAARPCAVTARFWIYPALAPTLAVHIGWADGRRVLVRRIRVIPEHAPGGVPLPTPHQVWPGFALFDVSGALLRLYVRPSVDGALYEWTLPQPDRSTAGTTLGAARPGGVP